MINWFSSDLLANTHIVTSDSDFTFNQIIVKFLKHYIKHSDAELNAEWKLMFMNNHDFHLTSEFISLMNDYHIRSFSLISHLTHCIQSLDVEIFSHIRNDMTRRSKKSLRNRLSSIRWLDFWAILLKSKKTSLNQSSFVTSLKNATCDQLTQMPALSCWKSSIIQLKSKNSRCLCYVKKISSMKQRRRRKDENYRQFIEIVMKERWFRLIWRWWERECETCEKCETCKKCEAWKLWFRKAWHWCWIFAQGFFWSHVWWINISNIYDHLYDF
jgi:hypothetical protein